MNFAQHLSRTPVSLSHVIAIAGRGDVLAGAVLLRPRGRKGPGMRGKEHDTL